MRSTTIRDFLQMLNLAFQVAKTKNKAAYKVNLQQLSQQFLSTAVSIEKLLIIGSPKQH
jgi:hypothetical protein